MALAFDGPEQRRAGINMTYTALLATDLLRREVGARPDHSAQCRAGAAARRHGAAGQHPELRRPGGGQRPRCRPASASPTWCWARWPRRCPSASWPARTRPARSPISSASGRDDGSTWVYLETIGGGSGARATKDGLDGVHVHTTNTSNLPVEALEIEYPLMLTALRAGRRFRRRRRSIAAAWACAASTRRPTTAACASTSPASARAAGACSAAAPGGHGAVEPRAGRGIRRRLGGAAGGPVVRHRHAGRRRLRPARPARPDGGRARPRRGRDQRRDGAGRVRPRLRAVCRVRVRGHLVAGRSGPRLPLFGRLSRASFDWCRR